MTDLPTYVLDREFDAPVALVWKAWTDPELLARWYGPGVDTIIHALDVHTGGKWLCEMRMQSGSMYQMADFTEVVEHEKLVWLHTTTDESWSPAPNPMMPDWPQTLLTTVTFEALTAERTAMRLTWAPHKASDTEIAAFAEALHMMDRGWATGMDMMAEILAEIQA